MVKILQSLFRNAPSCVRFSGTFSDHFLVEVGSDSELNLLLFIIVLEALSREIRSGCPAEILFTDNLPFVSKLL